MANENGLITQVDNPPTTGKFLSDNAATGEIPYNDANAGNLGLVANQTRVSADVNIIGHQPTAQNLVVLPVGDPNEPADQGTVQAGVTINGNFSVPAGQTVTLSASIVNGTVNVGNNARIIIKSHGGNPSRISKGLKATGAAEVIFYNSEIGGTVVFNNSGKFSASKGSLSSTVVTNNNTGAIVFDGVAIDDSLVATNNASISVTNCTINGDLILQHNASCSSPTGSNTVTGENNGCQS